MNDPMLHILKNFVNLVRSDVLTFLPVQIQAEIRSSQAAGLGSAHSMTQSLDYAHNVKKTSQLLRTRDRYDAVDNNTYHEDRPQSKQRRKPMAFVQGATYKQQEPRTWVLHFVHLFFFDDLVRNVN